MPSRPKPKPAPLHERAARSMRAHPWITWTSVGGVAGLLALAVPAVIWIDARYQPAWAAEAHERSHKQERAEVLYGQARLESLMLRNRAQDCLVRDRQQRRSETEARICQQYRDELKAAQERERVLYEQMQRVK